MAANTLAAYRRDLARLSEFAGGLKQPLTHLTRSQLEAFVRDLMSSGLSAASTARVVASTRGFFRFLRLIGGVAANPAEDLQAPRAFASLPRFLSMEDVDALLAAPEISTPRGLRDRALIEVLYATGLRVSELVGLRVTDVRVDQGYVQCLGKGRKQRIVPLGDAAADWVRRYVAEGRPALLGKRQTPWLFVNARGGGRLSRSGFWRLLKSYGLQAGDVYGSASAFRGFIDSDWSGANFTARLGLNDFRFESITSTDSIDYRRFQDFDGTQFVLLKRPHLLEKIG